MMRGDEDAVLERTFAAVPEPRWRLLLAPVGLVALVGLCAAPPAARMVGWMTALVVVLVAWLLGLFIVKGVYDNVIETRLSGSAPAGLSPSPSPALVDA
jgi:hypothetical protein